MTHAEKLQVREALTIPEVAELIGKGEQFINELIELGEVGFLYLGKKKVIPRFEIISFLKRNLKTMKVA